MDGKLIFGADELGAKIALAQTAELRGALKIKTGAALNVNNLITFGEMNSELDVEPGLNIVLFHKKKRKKEKHVDFIFLNL